MAPAIGQPDVRAWVTGAAIEALDANGHFVFDDAEIVSPFPVISAERAAHLANAYVRTFASNPSFVASVNAQREGAITDFNSLCPARRVEVANSPYAPMDSTVSSVKRRNYGPFFIVRVLEKGQPAIVIRVSAYATDVTIDNGLLVFPSSSGGEFDAFGVPTKSGDQNPVGPEVAVKAAAEATGAMIDEVPELLAPDRNWAFPSSRWRLHLDRPVRFQVIARAQEKLSRDLYVGLVTEGGRYPTTLFVPAKVQPTQDTVPADPPILLEIRPGSPVVFERVRVLR